jgi:uncharacterized OB-fold protein
MTASRDALFADEGGRITLQASTCPSCNRTEFPALTRCPTCGSDASPVGLGPNAVLAGFTEVLHSPPGAEVDVPYTIAIAAFADANLAVLGLLDHHVPSDELTFGLPLEVCRVETRTDSTYGFRLT